MRDNQLKSKWAAGEATLNGWLSIGDAFVAEIMAQQGYDSLTADLQHGFFDYGDMKPMFQAMRASGVTVMARVPWLDPAAVMKVLDAGAYGVICPMINTAEQAGELVSYMRYPPLGTRSYGPTRASYAAGAGYAAEANGQMLAIAMIETAQAMDNLDAICATDGLDGVYIGPSDLSLGVSNGRLPAGLDRQEPEMIDTFRHVLKTAKNAGIRAGIHCQSPAYAARAIGWGFDMATVSGDAQLLASAADQTLRQARDLISQTAGPDAK